MANVTGVRRMTECIGKYGLDTCAHYARALMDYSERITRQAVAAIPDGTYQFEDFLEDDGQGARDVAIRLAMTVTGDRAHLDFSRSDDQVRGSVNAVRAITLSAVLYVFRALAARDIPANAGCMRPLDVTTRPGSVVDAEFPAAVAGGNVETSQRLVDVLLGALAQALPESVPAASQGTMNNLTIGGRTPKGPFAYYETLAGGMGAGRGHDGESAVHSHMTNTLNTPVEALEYAYPFRVREYAILRGTGGNGSHKGGDGLVREIELLADAEVTVLSERRTRAPFGVNGGQPGSPGRNLVIEDNEPHPETGKFHRALRTGDRVRIETPGGGGFGKPRSS
jgi:N-methylhydantoinase B